MKIKLNVIFLIIAVAAVLAVVIAGFLVTGSPSNQRKIALDSRRLQDLSQLAQALYTQTRPIYPSSTSPSLPATLADLVKITSSQYLSTKDPETKAPYNYQITSSSTYQLCATFETSSQTGALDEPTYNSPAPFWNHPIGNSCFSFDITHYPPSYYYDGLSYPTF